MTSGVLWSRAFRQVPGYGVCIKAYEETGIGIIVKAT